MTCPLCERETTGRLSRHHLVPRSKGGKKTVPICHHCHRTIHAFYDNRRLRDELNTVESLQAEPTFAAHLEWLRKRPAEQKLRTRTRRARNG